MPLVKKKVSPTKAREILLQALYQKEISDISNTNLINQFKKAYREFDISNVAEKLKGINKNNDSLNKSIADNSSIEIKSIGEIEISINQPWQNKNKVPDQVLKSALARGINISVEKWRNLSELDRFAFCKLVRPSHEHNNLDRAFDEILK